MEKVRFGIIGLGNQGFQYTVNLFDKGLVENGMLTAVCDVVPAKIRALREKICTDGISFFDDYRKMLDSGLVDAVLVEAPHYLHPGIVTECLKRDIHVICEKPAGVYTRQVREMNEAASKSKALFTMMFNQRTNSLYQKMRGIIASGGLGTLQRFTWIVTNWYRTESYYKSGGWRATWAGEGGGVLINQCPHQLDLLQWVLGVMPVSVRAVCDYGKWHDIEVEDDVTAFFRFENGATGVFITTTGETPGTNRFEVSGTGGKLLCENDSVKFYKNRRDSIEFSQTSEKGFATPGCDLVLDEAKGSNPQHLGIINNFANAVLGLEPLFIDGREGIRGVELMNAIELSGWKNGAEVSLPVDEDEYLTYLNRYRTLSRFGASAEDRVEDTSGSFEGAKV